MKSKTASDSKPPLAPTPAAAVPAPAAIAAPAPAPTTSPPVSYLSGLRLPSPAPSQPAPNPAYDQGVADWRALQAWFATQTGFERVGADWWAANRSRRDHQTCAEATRDQRTLPAFFVAGCEEAKRRLDAIDVKRADPQYRAGFNDEAKRLPLQSDTAAQNGSVRYATVTTPDDLKLRTGPGANYSIVKIMFSGDRVKIIKDADNGWKELEFQDKDGQIFRGFSSERYLVPAQ